MKKLSTKITLGITLLILLVTILLVTSLPLTVKHSYREDIFSRLEIITQGNRHHIQSLPGGFKYVYIFPDSSYAAYNETGENFILPSGYYKEFTKWGDLQKISSRRYQSKINGEDLLYVIDKRGDSLVISYTFASTLDEVSRSLINNIFLIILFTYVIVLVAIAVFSNAITKPLSTLSKHVKKIASHDWHQPIQLNRKDEIGSLANHIETMRKELIEQDRKQKEMVQNLSHDLKTPIMVIQSYLEASIDGIYPFGTLEESLNVALGETKRLENKVKDIIYYNKLETVIEEFDLSDQTNMKDVIEEVVQRLQIVKELHFDLDLQDVVFTGSKDKWEVAIENILENFLRYADKEIKIILKKDSLSLMNDGESIPEDLLESIFIPYKKGNFGVFGLGLAIVNKIVINYHYNIKARNLEKGICIEIKKSE